MRPTRLPDNFFARSVLGIKSGEEKELLQSLESLSLHVVSFQSVPTEMMYVLNLTKLHTLKLWNCPYSLDLLSAISNTAQSLRYKSFELVIDLSYLEEPDSHAGIHDTVVSSFLKAFEGLEDLYLRLPQPTNWDVVAQGIRNHSSTLHRLVLHTGDEIPPENGLIPLEGDTQQLYIDANLSCIGISTPIYCWVRSPSY